MKEIDFAQQIQIRKELLHQFHNLCVDQNLKYSLGYGSLLGAVRHAGMIPWDDDVDVVMPRSDYNKLSLIFNSSVCQERYQVVNHRNHPEVKTKISYFIDFETIINVAGNKFEYNGVHIDIYPIDILPENYFIRKWLLIKRRIMHSVIRAKDVHPDLFSGKERLKRMVAKTAVLPFSYDRVLDKLNMLCEKYSTNTENSEAGCLLEAGREQLFSCKSISKYTLYDFDGEQYYGFSDYDSILKSWYGDYMTPPPETERIIPENKWVHYYYKD